MFPNLKAEMVRKNIKAMDIAELLGITKDTMYNKLSGKSDFFRHEIFKIKELFPDCTLEYLFTTDSNE